MDVEHIVNTLNLIQGHVRALGNLAVEEVPPEATQPLREFVASEFDTLAKLVREG